MPAYWNAVEDAPHSFSQQIPAPDLVLAPRVDDAHQDHRLLGRLVSTVWRDVLTLHYEIPKWDGDLRTPNHYVHVSGENARLKVELLNKSFFNEMTIRLPVPAAPVIELLAKAEVLAGVPVSRLIPNDPKVENLIVLAATELTTDSDIEMLAECLTEALK